MCIQFLEIREAFMSKNFQWLEMFLCVYNFQKLEKLLCDNYTLCLMEILYCSLYYGSKLKISLMATLSGALCPP